jgi:hypothetical protein
MGFPSLPSITTVVRLQVFDFVGTNLGFANYLFLFIGETGEFLSIKD